MRSLTQDGWKIIESRLPSPRVELYHLTDDPEEQHDLAQEQPEVATRMLNRLHTRTDSLPAAHGGRVTLTEEEKARLKALGYLD